MAMEGPVLARHITMTVHFRDGGGNSLKSPAATSWHVTAITTFGGGRA
jgi:hypothetical protein